MLFASALLTALLPLSVVAADATLSCTDRDPTIECKTDERASGAGFLFPATQVVAAYRTAKAAGALRPIDLSACAAIANVTSSGGFTGAQWDVSYGGQTLTVDGYSDGVSWFACDAHSTTLPFCACRPTAAGDAAPTRLARRSMYQHATCDQANPIIDCLDSDTGKGTHLLSATIVDAFNQQKLKGKNDANVDCHPNLSSSYNSASFEVVVDSRYTMHVEGYSNGASWFSCWAVVVGYEWMECQCT